MIQNTWDMGDLTRIDLFDIAQRQVIVLRPVKLGTKAAETSEQLGFIDAQMANEIMRQQ